MKPSDWDDWTDSERATCARGLLDSPRGRFLVSQALGLALQRLVDEIEPLEGEALSVVEDMEMLEEGIFYERSASSILKGEALRKSLEEVGAPSRSGEPGEVVPPTHIAYSPAAFILGIQRGRACGARSAVGEADLTDG